jgi:alanine-glyoxylate transaminase/serine-glyoxylate transaminase/serine-pyruvate transaminase
MRGRNHLYVPGPTNIPERVRRAIDVPLEDHRAPSFAAFSLPLLEDVKKIFRTTAGHVFLFPSTGTGGWEAAITNTLSPGDKVLQAVFGQFSLLWADLCRRLGMQVIEVETPWGEGVPLDRYREVLAADAKHEIKAVLVTHNETATGVTSPLQAVRALLDELGHPALLCVDGVSSIGCLDFRMDEWGIDLAVAGSQKGFMLPTGLALVGASPKALEARHTAQSRRCFFDFEDMLRFNRDGWFPYTPAATLLHGLRASIDMLLEEGLENVYARHHRFANAVRAAVGAWGLEVCARRPEWNSDTVTAVLVPAGFDSTRIVKAAHQNYNLALGLGLNKVAGKVFRIGHLGDLNELMVLTAVAGAEMAMRDAGLEIRLGTGVAAAQEVLRAGPIV